MLPERPAAADEILPHSRLRLVDAERQVIAGRQAELIGPQPRIVNAVPRLVQDAEKRGVEEPLVVPRSDAAVVRPHAAAEWMMRDVEPTAAGLQNDDRRRR